MIGLYGGRLGAWAWASVACGRRDGVSDAAGCPGRCGTSENGRRKDRVDNVQPSLLGRGQGGCLVGRQCLQAGGVVLLAGVVFRRAVL